MIIYIDKQGGRHYHKSGCKMIDDPKFNYEAVNKEIRKNNKYSDNYRNIRVDGKLYFPCPLCFGHSRGSLK